MKTPIPAAFLALAGLGLTAHAQSTIMTNPNDLIIGFAETSASTAQGASQNLEVDLGNVANYEMSYTNFVVSQFNGADITAIYGPNWDTAGANLYAAVFGWDGGTNSVNYIGVAATPTLTPGDVTSIPYSAKTTSQLKFSGTKIGAILGGMNYQTSTSNSAYAYNHDVAAGSTSLSRVAGAPVPTIALSEWTGSNFYDSTAIGPTGSIDIDLYQYAPGIAGMYVGTFDLNSAGVLTFYTGIVIIPEPSSYAVILGVASLGFTAVRRKNRALRYDDEREANR